MKHTEPLILRAVLENVPLAIDYVTQWAEVAGFEDRATYEIQLAVDEVVANVIHHAYRNMEPGTIEVSCLLDEQGLTIQVCDWGRGFDPESVSEPDVEAPLEERTLGGLGLFLVREVMDDVDFGFDPALGNTLRMTKRKQGAK